MKCDIDSVKYTQQSQFDHKYNILILTIIFLLQKHISDTRYGILPVMITQKSCFDHNRNIFFEYFAS